MGVQQETNGLAVITGASSGIGLEIARQLGTYGFRLLVVAEDDGIGPAARAMRGEGAETTPLQADLTTAEGVEDVAAKVQDEGEAPFALVLNAGVGVGGAFISTSLEDEIDMIRLNCISVVHLAKRLLPDMVRAGRGRVLITSSVEAELPGAFSAVYGATKAFLFSFGHAIRNELKDTGVTVTVLQPGATDTAFFERAGMLDTKVGASESKADPADVATEAVEAMLEGKDHIVPGWRNKLQMAMAQVAPEQLKAEMVRRQSEPGSARPKSKPKD